MADWYRQKTWSKAEESYFFTKLGRARRAGRAQYLKIQALTLIETKEKPSLEVAEVLINKLLSEYPDDKFNRSEAFVALGNIYQLRGDYDQAINYYQQALHFEAIYPQVQTQAYLCLSELVIIQSKFELYDTLANILLKKIPGTLFPVEKYKGYSILSIINQYQQNIAESVRFKNLAEQNANKETSGLKYHRYLGVVEERDSWLDKLIRKK